ncbi:unnamed protein product [Spirodela intermedia]|uniref:Uncharacterized protein n=1 Tax=Spirodela intermedia TaxID=51605 RepID=A0A7I8JU61_SPIIN|nr:unnamed protein product [Spirodela intermedia]CAA6673153.1 unnamed protein product [Spirodela intermedia]
MSQTYASLYYNRDRTDEVGPGCDRKIGSNLNNSFRVKLDVYLNIAPLAHQGSVTGETGTLLEAAVTTGLQLFLCRQNHTHCDAGQGRREQQKEGSLQP